MKRTWLFALILIWAGTGIGASARAQDAVRIAFDDASPMTSRTVRQTPKFQIYPAVVRRAFEHMGIPVQFDSLPFNRVLAELRSGDIGAGAVVDTEERREFGDFSEPYFTEQLMVYSRKDDHLNFRNPADFNGHAIGVLRGWSYGALFDDARKKGKLNVQEVDSDEQNFSKLQLGRVDYVVAPWQSGQILLSQARFADLVRQHQPLSETPICLAFNKTAQRKTLLANFNQTIRAMKSSGEIDKLIHEGIAQAMSGARK